MTLRKNEILGLIEKTAGCTRCRINFGRSYWLLPRQAKLGMKRNVLRINPR